jgi:RNA polymerase sigma-70 factor (ECF subfamily)
VHEAGAGDSQTFRQLFDSHAEALRRYARRIVRSRETAEDLVQDVFLRLWHRWEQVEMGPDIRAYLFTVTRSRALDHLRRERTKARAAALALPRGITGDEPALSPDADRKLEADEISRAIERVLATMPPRRREIIALRLRHHLPTAVIAQRLGISPRTVEVHIARATKTLREQLPALLSS